MNDDQHPGLAPLQDRAPARIHDALAGLLTAILMQLQAASDLSPENVDVRKACMLRAEELSRKGLRQLRELVEMYRLENTSHEGVLRILRAIVDATRRDTGIEVNFDLKGHERALNISTGVTLQRVLQESLTNAQNHAHAMRIAVQLCFEDDRVVLEVKDDGCGFIPSASLENGFGLVDMRARIDRVGGGLWLRSAPGAGTQIRVDLPNPYADT